MYILLNFANDFLKLRQRIYCVFGGQLGAVNQLRELVHGCITFSSEKGGEILRSNCLQNCFRKE